MNHELINILESLTGTIIAIAINEGLVKPFVVRRTQILSKRLLGAALGALDGRIFNEGIGDTDEKATEILNSLLGEGAYNADLALEELYEAWSPKAYEKFAISETEKLRNGYPEDSLLKDETFSEIEELLSKPDFTYTDRVSLYDTNSY